MKSRLFEVLLSAVLLLHSAACLSAQGRDVDGLVASLAESDRGSRVRDLMELMLSPSQGAAARVSAVRYLERTDDVEAFSMVLSVLTGANARDPSIPSGPIVAAYRRALMESGWRASSSVYTVECASRDVRDAVAPLFLRRMQEAEDPDARLHFAAGLQATGEAGRTLVMSDIGAADDGERPFLEHLLASWPEERCGVN